MEDFQDGSGKFYYLTRPPHVKIVLKSQLEDYHKRGRYHEMLVSNLDFGRKTRVKKYEVVGAAKRKKSSKQYNPGEQSTESGDEEVSVCIFLDEPTRLENDFETCEEVETEEEDIFGMKVDYKVCGKGGLGEKDLKLENEKKKLERKLENEKKRLENAVRKLTINPQEAVDHSKDLENSAKLLNEARIGYDNIGVEVVDFQTL